MRASGRDERQLGVEDVGRILAAVAAGPEVAELADGVRVEGARHHLRVAEGGHALDHLVGGLVRERDEQHPCSAGTTPVSIACAARRLMTRVLPVPGAGEDDQRPAGDLSGRALRFVQIRQHLLDDPLSRDW